MQERYSWQALSVIMNGERCAQPRNQDVTSGQYHDQHRPSSISPNVRWKMTTKAESHQWWLDSPDAESAPKLLPSADCSPLGISSLLAVTTSSAVQTWPYHQYLESNMSTDSGPTSEEDDNSYPGTDESREEQPWDEGMVFQELDLSNVHTCTVCYSSASTVPRMPLVQDHYALHRDKIGFSLSR